MDGFNYKFNNIMVGLLLRVPVFGKIIGKVFIPKIREMFEGMKIRDKYLYELIQAKKSELEKGTESTDGQGFYNESTEIVVVEFNLSAL